MTYIEFCIAVAQLMAACGGRITSWGRSPFGNDEVGGVLLSWHTLMMGVDWTWSEAELLATTVTDKKGRTMNGRERMKVLAPKLGLEVIGEGDHLHLEPKGSKEE